ncbi:MAG: prepilin-type N-terminal cleavage/methylation domain-containing protein [Verrucomicrobia bacterium]|nr:prepilin-type N-terminal cleavage/methylation domain-containing protein [Verrucomicrobiota bacterium]NBU10415.1 prepilin-type N-terminal cleavage/methylation domain-containing protein [Pseudomonadota bacterium]NDA65589.1 prepilin-type N-terminal cleavage/methylation domain-containing protein [Verrucomicrobiota bacterium]NDB75050.1 prepilin-type N-terminal cleavage/methylation domain-containing protein [Verrucomicrobiota bacterium]NDD37430.1 prepilin-type N-terminal cleavage/methylation domai
MSLPSSELRQPFLRLKGNGFTLLELLVVVAVVAVLAGLLLPVLAKAKDKSRGAKCSSNLKQMGNAFLLYATDHADQLTPFNSGGPFNSPVVPHSLTNWWYQILSDGKYLSDVRHQNGVWRCPAVMDKDIQNPFGVPMEGYGPLENTNALTGLPSIINYSFDHNGGRWGSARLTDIQRASQVWLVGDVGQPRDPNSIPAGGYKTEICTFAPSTFGGWPQVIPKQPACRHNLKTKVCFVDGHIEEWNYGELSTNKNDVFALKQR